ncbi:CDP-diacylglycerol--glycerol-3-phosphate 3-phosphatidyltransferase [Kineococcus xinjiangensis]|uniref:CDP-diacylglycerol--glycerol-3-phosphate 3-phosphatidyltransferase n=1 Tax=Kineococcus xinjiangensis TaxID=512762 RepID=A0A2S6IVT6_9ACTN|nr:CDP-diacylglycerol--glycerol-3-phosphate 3-phosphatidyltransferase [Kineococcus xinjiangensis]PPK98477.1 CDP-diacylglycerol--glycerol-3-phosphate 3-phosphatidyltransferase [Kineococcus xinjiangensis]
MTAGAARRQSRDWRTAHWYHLPNALTVLRIVAVPLFVWLLAHDGGDDVRWRLGAFAVFLAAIITDRYDGYLARRWNRVTDFGKMADPIADKALIGGGLVVLSWLGELSWWATGLILAREGLVTLVRFLVIRRGVIPAGKGGKIKTVVQSVALGAYVLPLPQVLEPVATAIMLAAVVLTLVTAWEYFVAAYRLWRPGTTAR